MRLSASLSHTLPVTILSLLPVCHSFAFPISLLCFPCLSSVPSFFPFPITSLFSALSASPFSSQLLSSVLLFPYQAFPTQLRSCSFPCSVSPCSLCLPLLCPPCLHSLLFILSPAALPQYASPQPLDVPVLPATYTGQDKRVRLYVSTCSPLPLLLRASEG